MSELRRNETKAVAFGPVTVYQGDVREVLSQLPAESVQCCVTSPPYWGLRDYGAVGQLGLEATPDEYVCAMVEVFREVRRVLRKDGTLWLNLGDSYAAQGGGKEAGLYVDKRADGATWQAPRRPTPGLKPKDLVGIPWRVAFALQADGWYLRSDIIWSKSNPMPESVTDRPTKAHEYLFLLTRSPRYYYDADAIREDGAGRLDLGRMKRPEARLSEGGPWVNDNGFRDDAGRNKRSVWEIATQPYPDAHFATFPEDLVVPCIKAGSCEGDVVLDPFAGSGTTLAVARRLSRKAIGIELQETYLPLIEKRVSEAALPLLEAI